MHIRDLLERDPALRAAARRLVSDPGAPFPVLSAKVKLTWRCNLRCAVCDLWRPEHRAFGATLSLDRVLEALTVLRHQGLVKIHFSGGEVLLYPDFRRVVTEARAMGLQVNLTTNGTRLDKDWARFLVAQRVHRVTVSIDSADPKEHDRMRGVSGSWKKALKGIDALVARRSKKGHGPKVAVNTLVTRANAEQVGDMVALLRAHEVDAWRLLPLDTDQREERPTPEQWTTLSARWDAWRPLLERVPLDWTSPRSAERAGKGKFAGVFYPQHRCFAPWFNLFIDADGAVYPCCMGKAEMLPFGNINDTGLASILLSEARWALQCAFAARRMYPVCERCDDFLEENLTFHTLIGERRAS